MFKDGVVEYYTVCADKCILKSLQFLGSKIDINFTWTYCTLRVQIFACIYFRESKKKSISRVLIFANDHFEKNSRVLVVANHEKEKAQSLIQ